MPGQGWHRLTVDPPVVADEAMCHDIDVLNDEMKAAGARIFIGGLRTARSGTWLRAAAE
jgi:hypothetical protein